MKNKALIAIVILILTTYFSYNYIYHQHRNVLLEKAKYHLTSDSLFNHFKNNQTEANGLYINEIIALKGTVKNISTQQLILYPSVVCRVDSNFVLSGINPNDSVELKGRCIGFDDLFLEVKMDKTTTN